MLAGGCALYPPHSTPSLLPDGTVFTELVNSRIRKSTGRFRSCRDPDAIVVPTSRSPPAEAALRARRLHDSSCWHSSAPSAVRSRSLAPRVSTTFGPDLLTHRRAASIQFSNSIAIMGTSKASRIHTIRSALRWRATACTWIAIDCSCCAIARSWCAIPRS